MDKVSERGDLLRRESAVSLSFQIKVLFASAVSAHSLQDELGCEVKNVGEKENLDCHQPKG